MRDFNIIAAFVGGAVIGAALGLLFAPEKGEDTRSKIKAKLKEKGLDLEDTKLTELVEDIIAKIKKEEPTNT